MRHLLLLLTVLCASVFSLEAYPGDQDNITLPAVQLRDANGKLINTADLSRDTTPVVVSFWATWCKPCLQELVAYNSLYKEWQEKYGVKIVAVSIDDSRNAQKVPAFIKGRNWLFEVLLDVNQDFKRAMNVNNVPHTFLVKGGRIVWQHASYAAGDEEDLENEIKKITGREG
ncbi:MAG: TlpA family protein disulfide reductase [Candidatus Kapabacteria bacterium]|jgi:peroxiredoxin|nr:TlpA family protein disulfide reductase [Candidatus Kapabacteria bacterium]